MCCLNPGLALQASLQQSDFPGDTCGRVFIIWKPEGDSKIDEAAMNREPEDWYKLLGKVVWLSSNDLLILAFWLQKWGIIIKYKKNYILKNNN